ncbi:hypothetical protein [Bradyrhizobium sp. 26S5]|uniref:hypothetical protein n=1 Tax=Bradyrhizobium sp. 26S5 TaxID=3139729 RepID=UPI0030D1F8C8
MPPAELGIDGKVLARRLAIFIRHRTVLSPNVEGFEHRILTYVKQAHPFEASSLTRSRNQMTQDHKTLGRQII